MNVTTQKQDIIHWVTELTDHTTLALLGRIKERSTHRQDWWSTLSVAEQASIEQGLLDAANGNLTSHSEVKKRYEHWLDN
jgi:predicted transcriptional regulator